MPLRKTALKSNNGGNKMPQCLEDNNLEHICVFCEYGTPLPPDTNGNVFVLCKKQGLVRDDFVCRRFSYDPLKREPAGKAILPKIEAVNIDEL